MTNNFAKQAISRFDDGFSCAQAVFSTYSPFLGFEANDAVRLARAFGGGLAHLGQTCGVVSAAAMLLGLTVSGDDEQQNKKAAYSLISEFADRFRAAHGSINCTELLGCDLGSPDGMSCFKEKGLKQSHCHKYITIGAEIIEDLLKKENVPL